MEKQPSITPSRLDVVRIESLLEKLRGRLSATTPGGQVNAK